jgi:hypothetical protein
VVAVPRVAHIFALAGVLNVSMCVCRPESIPSADAASVPSHEKKLVIFLISDSALAPAASSEMKQELSHLLQPAAIHVEWQDPAVDRDAAENDYSALVRLRGSCHPTVPSTRFEHAVSGPFTLASSAVSDGVVLPFGDIDCAALNFFLGPSLWKESGPVQEFVYARAIARLMAHELYHVIGQTHDHAHSGVAESSFTVAELLSDNFEFTETTLSELHASPDVGEYSEQTDSDGASGK